MHQLIFTERRRSTQVEVTSSVLATIVVLVFVLQSIAIQLLNVVGLEPSFDVPIVNVTVVASQTAVLPCSIEYLGKYKVAWLDVNSVPLTYEDRRVIDDTRFSVVRPYQKEWNLQIRDIRPDDQGQYRCTINTSPVKSKVITLHVKVPAAIIDHLSSDDVNVQEGETVVLICNVTGVPTPDVTWYRRPATSTKSSDKQRIGTVGEMIIIKNVTRYCDDIYECVATNGVPPSVHRQIRVTVEFAPEITLPNRRLGQALGRETILECIITAFPQAVNYWEKDGRRISSSAKYRTEAYDDGDHTIILSLRIHDIDKLDFGEYKCVASNPLGQDQQVMYLYEYSEPSVSSPPKLFTVRRQPDRSTATSNLPAPTTRRPVTVPSPSPSLSPSRRACPATVPSPSKRTGPAVTAIHLYSRDDGTTKDSSSADEINTKVYADTCRQMCQILTTVAVSGCSTRRVASLHFLFWSCLLVLERLMSTIR